MPEVTPLMLVSFVLFFVLGFLFYAALYAAIGAAVNTVQEAQSLAFPVMAPIILAAVCFPAVLESPDGVLAVTMSMMPGMSPLIMFLRIVVLTPPAWQVALSIALLGLGIFGVVWVASRVYRVGNPDVREEADLPRAHEVGAARLTRRVTLGRMLDGGGRRIGDRSPAAGAEARRGERPGRGSRGDRGGRRPLRAAGRGSRRAEGAPLRDRRGARRVPSSAFPRPGLPRGAPAPDAGHLLPGGFCGPMEREARVALFDEAKRVAEETVATLEAERKRSKGRVAASAAVERAPTAAEEYLWAAISWGQWAVLHRMSAALSGAPGRIRDLAEAALEIDPSTDQAGAYILLGRLHAEAPKVLFVTGWVSRKKAVAYVREGMTLAPDNRALVYFTGDILLQHSPESGEEARALLERCASLPPRPGFLAEDLHYARKARERLAGPR